MKKATSDDGRRTAPLCRNAYLRHVLRGDFLDLELDVLALVADVARRRDVAVAGEAEGVGPLHLVPRQVEVDRRLLAPGRADTGPMGWTCGVGH